MSNSPKDFGLPEGPFNIIYADVPWQYQDKASAGKRGACHKYPVMSIDDIIAMPVKDIAAENAVLFMWVTMPHLNIFMDVVNSWGFNYKTVAFTWVKKNKKADSPFWGMGRWTRANAEICILATKGSPKRQSAGVHSIVGTEEDEEVICSPIREHSRKPDAVRERIVELCGDLPRIELFAREQFEGWTTWGNEVGNFSQEESLEDIL